MVWSAVVGSRVEESEDNKRLVSQDIWMHAFVTPFNDSICLTFYFPQVRDALLLLARWVASCESHVKFRETDSPATRNRSCENSNNNRMKAQEWWARSLLLPLLALTPYVENAGWNFSQKKEKRKTFFHFYCSVKFVTSHSTLASTPLCCRWLLSAQNSEDHIISPVSYHLRCTRIFYISTFFPKWKKTRDSHSIHLDTLIIRTASSPGRGCESALGAIRWDRRVIHIRHIRMFI